MISWHLFFGPAVHPMPILGHIFCFGWDLRIFTEVTCATIDDFMTSVLRTCRASDAILGHIFYFGWDLRIFTEVTCATTDDFMTSVLWTCHASDAILGHIFRFRWDLWIFTYVVWSMIDDFMSPDFWPVIRSMPTHTGAYYRSRWDLQILVGLCTYPHLRDMCRDGDLFAIFTMIPRWRLLGVA